MLFSTNASSDTNDPVVADALFREARELLKEKKYEEACPKFAESYRLDPAIGTLYNLAECEENRGKIAAALERWRALIDTLTIGNKLADPRLPVARLRVTALSKRVPMLVLKLKEGAPKDTVLLMDNVELRSASLDTELPIEPGEHTILARAPYRHDGKFKVLLKEGERQEVIVEPGGPDGTQPRPSSSGPPTSVDQSEIPSPDGSPQPSPATSLRRPVGLVIAGAGLASLIGAGITGLMLNNRKDIVEKNCNDTTRKCSPEGYDAARSTGTLVPLNLALWAVGVIGVGVGGYLTFTTSSGTSAQVSITSSTTQSSLWLQGQF